jgi:SRSO17 transposase
MQRERRKTITEQTESERENSLIIQRWSTYLKELHARIAHRFLRPEVSQRAYRYLTGLLEDVRRKNSWQMAEAIGEARPRGVQHFLNDARWDANAVRDDTSEAMSWSILETRKAACSSWMRRAS